jgi:hypothetical protein
VDGLGVGMQRTVRAERLGLAIAPGRPSGHC